MRVPRLHMETSLFSATRQIGSTFTMLADSITSIVAGNATYTAPDGTTKTSAIGTLVQQTAGNVLIQATSSATTAAQAGAAVISSLINVATTGVTISASKVDIEGAAIFQSGGRLSQAGLDAAYDAKGAADAANSQAQRVWISKASGTASVTAPSAWVTSTSDSQGEWTTKRPTYSASYPVLFVATQLKTVGGTVTCTTPLRDDTTTVIDGGHITTGTIDATTVAVTNIDGQNIRSGTISVGKMSDLKVGGRNIMSLQWDGSTKGPVTKTATESQNYLYLRSKVLHGLPLAQGETLTLSADVSVTPSSVTKVTVRFYDGDVSRQYQGLGDLTISDGRISATFAVNSTLAGKDDAVLLLYAGVAGSTAGNSATFSNMKLERGTVPTGWTPAPEDMASADELDTVSGELGTQVGELSTRIDDVSTAAKAAVDAVDGAFNDFKRTLDNWIAIDETGLTVGSSASPGTRQELTATSQEFYVDNQRVMAASNGTLGASRIMASEVHVGEYMWVGRSNGHCSLKYVG